MGAGLKNWITQGQKTSLQSHNKNPIAGYKQNQVKFLKQEINWATSAAKRLHVHINIFTPKRKWILSSISSNQWFSCYWCSWTALGWLKIWLGTNCNALGVNTGTGSISRSPRQTLSILMAHFERQLWLTRNLVQDVHTVRKRLISKLHLHVAVIFPACWQFSFIRCFKLTKTFCLTQTKHSWMNI